MLCGYQILQDIYGGAFRVKKSCVVDESKHWMIGERHLSLMD